MQISGALKLQWQNRTLVTIITTRVHKTAAKREIFAPTVITF
jgi:hypothetical protein